MHTKIFLLRHSLLTNISNALLKKVLPEKHSPSTENLRTSIYRLFDDSEVLNEFSLSPFAEATKKAIKAWGKDAKSQG